jgi:branched-chain amino acid transport system ATP-binding protein
MRDLLVAEGIDVRYGGSQAVRGVSLSVGAGKLVAVAGGNGAGKSSLVNAIAGWSRGRPTVHGRILLGGEDISSLAAHRRLGKGLVIVPEGLAAFSRMTVRENLALARPPKGGEGHAYSIDDIFRTFPNLAERQSQLTGSLSGGERQMVAVARALSSAPRVLILDEPSVGLAPKIVVELLQSVRRLVEEAGLSVLLVEQNVRAALAVADELYLLERGSVVAHGPADEMRDDPRISSIYLGGGR